MFSIFGIHIIYFHILIQIIIYSAIYLNIIIYYLILYIISILVSLLFYSVVVYLIIFYSVKGRNQLTEFIFLVIVFYSIFITVLILPGIITFAEKGEVMYPAMFIYFQLTEESLYSSLF
jgi:hypothetical protein